MALRLELFVTDLHASVDFYSRVLRFQQEDQHPDGYTPMVNGTARIGLNLRSILPDDLWAVHERAGRGVEIVLEVDNVAAMYQHVLAQNWPASALKRQFWGLIDFRVSDPDGYYWRVTSYDEAST